MLPSNDLRGELVAGHLQVEFFALFRVVFRLIVGAFGTFGSVGMELSSCAVSLASSAWISAEIDADSSSFFSSSFVSAFTSFFSCFAINDEICLFELDLGFFFGFLGSPSGSEALHSFNSFRCSSFLWPYASEDEHLTFQYLA